MVRFAPTSKIVAYDASTHVASVVIDAPCPALETATEDEQGNTYFSTWNLAPTLSLYGEGPAPCMVRIKPDNTLDEAWQPDFQGWTGGRPTTVWRYARDGKALGSVLHTEELGADFTTGYDPTVGEEIGSGNHYHTWVFDLDAESATQITGMQGDAGFWHWANFDGRTFVFQPRNSGEAMRTTIYEVNLDGTARELFEISGWVYEWLRVR